MRSSSHSSQPHVSCLFRTSFIERECPLVETPQHPDTLQMTCGRLFKGCLCATDCAVGLQGRIGSWTLKTICCCFARAHPLHHDVSHWADGSHHAVFVVIHQWYTIVEKHVFALTEALSCCAMATKTSQIKLYCNELLSVLQACHAFSSWALRPSFLAEAPCKVAAGHLRSRQ